MWDTFEDGPLRRELETRLYQMEPVEVVIPDSLSALTKGMILQLGVNTWGQTSGAQDLDRMGCVHLETLPARLFGPEAQRDRVLKFFEPKPGDSPALLEEVQALPQAVVGSLGVVLEYLRPFKLQHLLRQCSSPLGQVRGSRFFVYPPLPCPPRLSSRARATSVMAPFGQFKGAAALLASDSSA